MSSRNYPELAKILFKIVAVFEAIINNILAFVIFAEIWLDFIKQNDRSSDLTSILWLDLASFEYGYPKLSNFFSALNLQGPPVFLCAKPMRCQASFLRKILM